MQRFSWPSLVTLGLGLLATGCPNPNTYGTPRTVEPGAVSSTVALEAFGADVELPSLDVDSEGNTSESTVSQTIVVPTVPTYMLRVGVLDRMDVGVKVANLTSLGADVKYNFLKGKLDAAVDPGVQLYRVSVNLGDGDSTTTVTHLYLPLITALNLSQAVALTLTPGLTYSMASTSVRSGDELDAAVSGDGLSARLGVGANFRLSRGFALHPEVTYMRSFEDDGVDLYHMGLGLNFGHLPDRGDL